MVFIFNLYRKRPATVMVFIFNLYRKRPAILSHLKFLMASKSKSDLGVKRVFHVSTLGPEKFAGIRDSRMKAHELQIFSNC